MAGYTDALRLVDWTRLRAIGRAVVGDVESFEPRSEPDPALLDPVSEPFASPDDVTAELSLLEAALRARDDRRAVFLTVYTRMTRAVRDGIDDGAFADPEWMTDYLVAFANYYRRAFHAFERGDLAAVPDPWRVAFGTAVRGDALVTQDAFLGVNAHITYDLGLTLTDVGIDPDRRRKYADHQAIDDILARLVDAQQDALADHYASGIDAVDAAFGQFDESVTLVSMTGSREFAWRVAAVVTDVGLAPVRSYARWVLDATATGAAFAVREPTVDEDVHDALRAVEAGNLDAILDDAAARMDAVQ